MYDHSLRNISIRAASANDARSISGLLRSLSHTYVASPAAPGAERLLATLTEGSIAAFISRADVFYLVAESANGELAGAAAMQDHRAVAHLFVSPSYQGLGLGRRLWESLRDDALRAGNPGSFTVKSSVGAVPIYEKFGFRVVSPRVEKDGGVYVPMALELPRSGR
jgi:GNAT superfamily N-acetyltransferase